MLCGKNVRMKGDKRYKEISSFSDGNNVGDACHRKMFE